MLDTTQTYNVVLLGYYTKDTIISAAGARLIDDGDCNYGANVEAGMGLNTAVVTRLVQEDFHVVDKPGEVGIDGEGQ